MVFEVAFEKLINYDAGKPGISLDVELRVGDSSVNFEAKIDTGATYCIFERVYGEKLGLDIESGEQQRIGTAVGSFSTFGHSVTLMTENFEFDSMVFFAQDENFRRNVLGRHGWLDRVVVGIDDYDGKLYLSEKKHE